MASSACLQSEISNSCRFVDLHGRLKLQHEEKETSPYLGTTSGNDTMSGKICRPLYNVRGCHVEKGHVFSTSLLLNLLRFSQRNHINQICFQLYEKCSLNGSQLRRKLNGEENLGQK